MLEARVAAARSDCKEAIERRARDMAQAAIDDYFADKIDEDELKRRKLAANEGSSAEEEALKLLEEAYGAWLAASASRVAKEEAFAKAVRAEDKAADQVDDALRTVSEYTM